MKKRLFAASIIATTMISACSLGGSSDSVVGSINTSPVILNTQLNVSVPENQSLAFTISAIDANFERLRLDITGPDADDFEHPGGGEIMFVAGPNFEAPTDADMNNVYEITISVSDGLNSDSKSFTVTVTDDTSESASSAAKCTAIGSSTTTQSCTLTTGGADRAFTLYVPGAYSDDQSKAAPLLFSLHGDNETASANLDYSGFPAISEKAGFIIAYPQGATSEATGRTHWNTESSKTTDMDFMGAIREYLTDSYKINPDRVYAVGMGTGGSMSYKLACEAADHFTAIGSVAGAMTMASCAPSRPVPAVHIHGKLDGVVPYAGSALNLPIDNLVSAWAKSNGCAATGTTSAISDVDGDVMGGTLTNFGGCKAGANVAYYLLDGMDHSWPDGTNGDVNAAETIWDFFSGIEP